MQKFWWILLHVYWAKRKNVNIDLLCGLFRLLRASSCLSFVICIKILWDNYCHTVYCISFKFILCHILNLKMSNIQMSCYWQWKMSEYVFYSKTILDIKHRKCKDTWVFLIISYYYYFIFRGWQCCFWNIFWPPSLSAAASWTSWNKIWWIMIINSVSNVNNVWYYYNRIIIVL